MVHFLSVLLQVLRRNLFLFIFIVLVLVAGKVIRTEWVHIDSIANALPALRAAERNVGDRQAALTQAVAQRVGRLSAATVHQLDAEITALESEISHLQRQQNDVSLVSGAFKGADSIVDQLRQRATRGVDLELRRQARSHLIAVRTHVVARSDRQAALAKLEQLRQSHVQIYAAIQSKERQLSHIAAVAGVLTKIPFTKWHQQAEKLKHDVTVLQAANSRAHEDYVAQKAVLDGLSLPAALTGFRIDQQRLAGATAALRDRLVQAENLAAQNHLWQAYQAVRPLLPTALFLLLGWWLVPAAIRTLFYFVLAPQAARMAPIVIGTATGRAAASTCPNQRSSRHGLAISAVSQTTNLAADHEMLIRPDYCQSQPAGVHLTTKLLFSWHHWLTSMAAHLWMLKRLRTTGPADIVVSSTADVLDEVALLDIAAGDALVLQPRGLVGMIYKTGQRPIIRSHWRLGTLHAWLTFQLRYLAFEGPVTLVVKGCRGVRLESTASGRTISQDATLGFSANAKYATVRAEPFLPYLRGRQPLFHDQFSGEDAWYLYEEVPRNARADGQRSNPLEALIDASLKAFGI